jgi:hypothetical protein
MVTSTGQLRQFETMGRSVTFVPLVIKRRHRSKLIVPSVGASAVKATASFDLPLIRTLGKAFYWQRLIDTGEVANAGELARSLKLEVGVGLRSAPDDAVGTGHHPGYPGWEAATASESARRAWPAGGCAVGLG